MKNWDISLMDEKIREMKKIAYELEELAEGIEAVKRNLVRLKATLKMLELNISDLRLLERS